MEIVRQSGTALAFPAQTLYLGRDSGLDQEKTSAAERQVQDWRDQHQLPFPDFAPSDKALSAIRSRTRLRTRPYRKASVSTGEDLFKARERLKGPQFQAEYGCLPLPM